MPSWLAHVPAAIGAAAVVAPPKVTRRFWVTAALCGIIPDVDYLGAPFGLLAYSDFFGGHRGITHGIPFAVVIGSVLAWLVYGNSPLAESRLRLAVAFALALATHAVLDAMTDVGPPIAVLSPFSASRFTFAWHPIDPSAVARGRGLAGAAAVIGNEFLWGGLPGLVLLWLSRRLRSRGQTP